MNDQWLYNTANPPSLIKIDPNYSFTWHATYHADGFDVKYIGGWAHYITCCRSPASSPAARR